jgi:hypothetical protein
MDTPHFRDPRLLDYLLGDEVLDLVEPLIGPDIVLWSSHFIVKEARVGKATPWHEDSAYWEGRLSYLSSATTVIPEANPGHLLWLARGHDRAGNSYVNA